MPSLEEVEVDDVELADESLELDELDDELLELDENPPEELDDNPPEELELDDIPHTPADRGKPCTLRGGGLYQRLSNCKNFLARFLRVGYARQRTRDLARLQVLFSVVLRTDHKVPVEVPASYVIIPARLASTRLPRKLLLKRTGKSVLQHTYEATLRSHLPRGVLIATDSSEILHEAQAFGADVVLTSIDCASGTDRVAEAAQSLRNDIELIINVQGDEPEIDPTSIDRLIAFLSTSPELPMATLCTPIRERGLLDDPSCVKVVSDQRGRALYFSRSPIPAVREWHDDLLIVDPPVFFQHIGVYGYRRNFLRQLSTLPYSALEHLEQLEQLRVLAAGYEIGVAVVPRAARGIDTIADYEAFVDRNRGP